MNGGTPKNKSFSFEKFRLSEESQILYQDESEVHLPKRPFQILLYLIENRDRVVSRNELLDKYWEGHDVYDDALRKTVGSIRKALCDLEKPPKFIETRWGSGYHFIGDVQELEFSGKSTENHAGNSVQFKPYLGRSSGHKWNRSNGFRYILISIFIISLASLHAFEIFNYRDSSSAVERTALDQTPSVKRSIAVMPLKNMTGDVSNDFLSDGITESLITELSRHAELRVISRSSVFTFKDVQILPEEIGKKLNVDSLLEGSIQRNGQSLSVSIRLISTKDGHVLWTSQNYERPLSKSYELQNLISCTVADELGAELCGTLTKNIHRNTENSDAFHAYLKGRYQWNKRTEAGIRKSIEFYDQAISYDEGYSLAYAGLAESYVQGIWHAQFDPAEVLPKARKAALKAIELDESLAEAHTALANVYELNWDWLEAERALKRSAELNPYNARTHHVFAFYYLTVGNYSKAIELIEIALSLDPLNLVINTDKANILNAAGRKEEAFTQWEKTLELDQNFALAYLQRSIAYGALGNETASVEDTAKWMELEGKPSEQVSEYREDAKNYGLNYVIQKELNELYKQRKNGRPVSDISFALSHSMLGQKDESFKWLNSALKNRRAELVLLRPDSRFASLRSEPRYFEILRRMGLPE